VPLGNVGDVTLNGVQTLTNKTITSLVMDGTPVAPTQPTADSSTKVATTAYVNSVAFAPVLPAQSGATADQFLQSTGASGIVQWNDVYPSQTSNNGKFLKTNGSTASWAFAGISQVTTATTATTLTSTPTLIQITPVEYGVTVTLPNATTCSVGGPLHCIDNRGAFPVRVCNTSGTLLGFVFAGVVSYISLDNNSTAAGIWAASAAERVGISAAYKYTGTVLNAFGNKTIDLGSGRELLWGSTSGYAVVYDRTTNTFGTPTLIRAAGNSAAVLMSTDKVLYCSSDGSTGFEAVVLSITGTSIAVGTPVAATLSAGSNGWPTTYSALSLVGTSAVVSYPVSGPTCEIRAITVSGTVPTIGAATVLDGTTGGLGAGGHGGIGMVASSSVIIYASYTPAGNLYTKPYTISGTTITPGTGTNTSGGTMLMHKFYPLGTRWVVVYSQAGTSTRMLLVSLSGTTTTVSVSIPGLSVYTTLGTDAAVIGTTKSLIIGSTGTGALLLDTAGTASATTVSITGGAILWVSGTDVAVQDTDGSVRIYDCSTSTPVLSKYLMGTTTAALFARSDVTLGRSATALRSGAFCRNLYMDASTQAGDFEVSAADVKLKPKSAPRIVSTTGYSSGTTEAAAWFTDAQTAGTIYKLECVV
jgi:hypothetical protein